MKFKSSQIYTWESEPAEERPSEFMTTGYSQLSGLQSLGEPGGPASRSAALFGFKSWLTFAIVLIGLGAYSLAKFAPLLRG